MSFKTNSEMNFQKNMQESILLKITSNLTFIIRKFLHK